VGNRGLGCVKLAPRYFCCVLLAAWHCRHEIVDLSIRAFATSREVICHLQAPQSCLDILGVFFGQEDLKALSADLDHMDHMALGQGLPFLRLFPEDHTNDEGDYGFHVGLFPVISPYHRQSTPGLYPATRSLVVRIQQSSPKCASLGLST
jgi:hypothetical protein